MTRPAASCPSCGAPVEFLWSGAVQTTCGYCRSVLVRRDLDLEAVGRKSQVPITASPVRIGTRGELEGRPFQVVGRIVYEYERGRWSEWHLVFADGTSGWLSDALAEYAVSFPADAGALPPADTVQPGQTFWMAGTLWKVASLTRARYAGTEGELPFEYWDKDEVPFADLKTAEGDGFATIDYSEAPPLLFAGRYVEFADLRLTGLATEDEAAAPRAEAETFSCPNCGGTVEVRAAGLSVNVVCRHCASVLDARSPAHQVLQNFKWNIIREPRIPLGTRGRLHGAEWDVLGFQVRTIRVEGVEYSWDEYLLYNRERGFRYLTEYQGHWNDVVTLRSTPRVGGRVRRPMAHLHGTTFKHFQTAEAETTFVLGEFPWEVRVGDKALTNDYVAPPRILSLEQTEGEDTWSLGEYVPGTQVWEAFALPGKPPLPKGVFANQPSPHRPAVRQMWAAFAVLLALFLVFLFYRKASTSDAPVASASFAYDPFTPEEERGVVLGPFQVGGRTSNLDVKVRTDLDNQWAYFDFALVDEASGKVVLFGREVSFYHGVEGSESWSEGDRDESARVPSVPAGRYLLHVSPDGPAPVRYTVEVRRDVPATSFYVFAFLLLLTPPVFALTAMGSFETRRWAESDYAGGDDDE
ncbi:MAG TPA: DUF4178 domain-containing protein [Longimicrobium sp.]|jgi:predicted RNA-binding Zn-ribbon protein involved in translation (DUF1610 family)